MKQVNRIVTTRQFVLNWLEEHRDPGVPYEDTPEQRHFEVVLENVADSARKKAIDDVISWINSVDAYCCGIGSNRDLVIDHLTKYMNGNTDDENIQ